MGGEVAVVLGTAEPVWVRDLLAERLTRLLRQARQQRRVEQAGRDRDHADAGLRQVARGDFVYIPPGMPHQPYNASDEPCRAVIARTDPNEQESVVLLDAQGRKS